MDEERVNEQGIDKSILGTLREIKDKRWDFRGEAESELMSFEEKVAVIEFEDIGMLDLLSKPCFLAIENEKDGTYYIYLSTNATPSQESLVKFDPLEFCEKVKRKERLDDIKQNWTEKEKCWIDVMAIPTGYVLNKDGNFIKQKISFPLVGSNVYLLKKEKASEFLIPNEKKNICEIGVLEMLGNIPLAIDAYRMINYHIGIFGATGCGKPNSISQLLTLLSGINGEDINSNQLRVVIFDVTGEYIVHLLPLIKQGKVLVFLPKECFEIEREGEETKITNVLTTTVSTLPIPDTMEDYKKKIIEEIKNKEFKLFDYTAPTTILDIKAPISEVLDSEETADYATKAYENLLKTLEDLQIPDEQILSKKNVEDIKRCLEAAISTIETSARDSKAKAPSRYIRPLKKIIKQLDNLEFVIKNGGFTTRDLVVDIYSRDTMVYIIHLGIKDMPELRECVSNVIKEMFNYIGERGFAQSHYDLPNRKVLFIFDEAQEFIPRTTKEEDKTKDSSKAIERLIRQGRKYGLHALIASQRLAHLNTTVLSQLQSFFIGTITREYDKGVVAQATGLSPALVDGTTNLDVGEWLFTSIRATSKSKLPLIVKLENNEANIIRSLTQSEAKPAEEPTCKT